jgi:predicted permease
MIEDLKYAIRLQRRNPWVAFAIVASLGLAMGSCLTVFSVISGLLIEPLPVKDASSLVMISQNNPAKGLFYSTVSLPDLRDIASRDSLCERMSAFRPGAFQLETAGKAEQLEAAVVDGEFFQTLGVQPAMGRALDKSDDEPGQNHVIVISHSLWKSRFGGSQDIIGRRITLDSGYDNGQYTVIGVLPASFRLPLSGFMDAQIWAPLSVNTETLRASRGWRGFLAIARLRSSATRSQLSSELNTISSHFALQYPDADQGWFTTARTLRDVVSAPYQTTVMVLFGAVLLLLVIACANVASMLLAKGTARRKELAVRMAMGAARMTVVRQLFAESLLLAFAGGLLGFGLAALFSKILLVLNPLSLASVAAIHTGFNVALFAVLLVLVVTALCGLVPALLVTEGNVAEALKEGAFSVAGGRRKNRALFGFVSAEVGLCFALLLGAGLLFRTFYASMNTDPGFKAENIVAMFLIMPKDAAKLGPMYYRQMMDEVKSLPGAEAVAVVHELPVVAGSWIVDFSASAEDAAGTERAQALETSVSPGYFSAMKIPLLMGRDFSDEDKQSNVDLAIANQCLARRYFKDRSPIDAQLTIYMENGEKWNLKIIGVVGDTRAQGLTLPPKPQIYVLDWFDQRGAMWLVVRSGQAISSLMASLPQAVWKVNSKQPIMDLRSMKDVISESLSKTRLSLYLMAFFAFVALVLAVTGVYGVLAYTTVQRTREIGIRMAIGADKADVLKQILFTGMRPAFMGTGLGVVLGLLLGRAMASMLYSTRFWDPLTIISVAAILLACSGAASFLPARRAAGLEPASALRYE